MTNPGKTWIGALLLALAACAPAPPAAPAAPGPEGCADLSAAEKPACYEAALLEVLEARGVAAAMAALEEAGERDAEVKREGHVYAHAIGLAAYETPGTAGATFGRCTPIYQSGCYHGVIQAYFADRAASGEGITAGVVNSLCRDYRGEDGDRWLLFQCAHGMGHGLTQINGHHLPRALEGCDLVESDWEREACYGGAFMENIVQATSPHHTVGRPQVVAGGGGEHAHHGGHGAAAEAPAYRALDPADPLYPCSQLETRYLFSCYQMQTSAILFHNQGDFRATARVCSRAPEAYRAVCFQSLGRDVSAYTVQDHGEAIRLCSRVEARYRPSCHVGYVKNLIDLTADADDGLAYCREVPGAAEKTACYTAVGEQVWVLAATRERREELCRPAGPDFVDACRHGAGLMDNYEL